MSVEKTFNGLPGWAKGVLAVGLLAGIAVLGTLGYQKIKKLKEQRDSKNEALDVGKDLSVSQKNKPQTLTQAQVSSIANALFTAMNGYGTDYNVIVQQMAKINNQTDLLAIIKSYDVRTLSSGNWNPSPNVSGTLTQHLTDELSDAQLEAINNMLSRKGIKNRF